MENEEYYILCKKGNTEEIHIFRAKPSIDKKNCTPTESESICKMMKKYENHLQCFTLQGARNECARIGATICGVCVSHLYNTTYKP